jgi:predicted O-linked N-acetylglucosamine transferase (SPINDLY family)
MLVRLAFAQWCYRPYLSIDPATQAPVERNGYITFGSFNQVSKVSSLARQLWAEILLQLPESRLVIDRASEGAAQDRLLRDLETAGVAAGRISFRQAVPLEEYFRRFNDVDIALDTMPYSGCTTTCDTLWMGVPVVTLPGSSSLSRASASILSVTGLADWIAPTREDYVRLNLELAQDRARLSELRGLLRQRMRVSPLMDETGFARGVEAAYRGVWKKWCEGAAR